MKKLLAVCLSGLMLLTAVVGAVTVSAETTAKTSPTTLKNFKETRGFDILGDHSKSAIVDGHIEVRPASADSAWEMETDEDGNVMDTGKFIDSYVKLDIAWYLRMNKEEYTEQSLVLDANRKYVAYKVKMGNNYTEDPVYEAMFTVPLNPDQPRGETGTYWLYSTIAISADDGYDYIVFDASASDDYDMWRGPLSFLELKWASRKVSSEIKDEAFLDIYEICFFDSEEGIEAYVGTEVDWDPAFVPVVPQQPETETEDASQYDSLTETESVAETTEAPTDEDKGGCGSFIASASVLAVMTMAAGAVVCKKKD